MADSWTEGSPFQVGDAVAVLADGQESHMFPQFWHLEGVVCALDYRSGVGQRFPEDPFIEVQFSDGRVASFWQEELLPIALRIGPQLVFPWGESRADSRSLDVWIAKFEKCKI